jgi:hypothetical protein
MIAGIFVSLSVLAVVLYVLVAPREMDWPRVSYCTRCEARFRDSQGLVWHMQSAHPRDGDD